jgi:tetratricopeptide (TPR) repeat protein
VLFPLGAVLLGLLPLGLLELGLRVFDVGRPAAAPDPFGGFNRRVPLFDRQGPVYRTARARAPLVASQEFPVEKPAGSGRIFCFGGSTVYGHPYLGDTAFPRWLELELAAVDPARRWQVINAGGISYASYRIAPLVREVLQYQPDLIVVATGHNEFLEDRSFGSLRAGPGFVTALRDAVHSLHLAGVVHQWLGRPPPEPAGHAATEPGPVVMARLDQQSGYASYRRDPEWHARVAAQFDESLRAMLASCRAAGVPILFVRLGSNLRDCPPFKSEHRAALAPERENDWQAAFDLASAAEPTDPARALQYYQEAAAIDGDHALLSFRLGRTLDRLGRRDEALRAYEEARDDDICPLRITSTLDRLLTGAAAATGTPLVDAAALLVGASADGIPGHDQYVDHVHPSIAGHQRIAGALATRMRHEGWLPRAAPWPDDARRATYTRHLTALGPAYFADGDRRVAWLDQWARRQRLAAELQPSDAAGYARWGFRRLDLGREEEAAAALREALRRSREVAPAIRDRARELEEQGRPEHAALLRQLLDG